MKLLTILVFLCVGLNGFATKRYFATTGSDATGAGTNGNPYATLFKAVGSASAGDTVHGKAGTYVQSAVQVAVPVGVTIEGEGTGATKIILTYFLPGFNGFNNAAIQLVSTIPNTNGNQSIYDIWFDGNNFGCFAGILVRARGNVTIRNCKFTNFGITAINLNGKTGQGTGEPPAGFAVGNDIINCSFIDCNDRITQAANSVSCGSITIAGQDGLLMQYDTLRNINKPQGHNGDLEASIQGNNKHVIRLNNIYEKPPDEGASFNFCIENWYDMGGCEIGYCTFIGGGNAVDLGYGSSNKGSDPLSWYIHDNTFTNPALVTSAQNLPNVTAGAFVTGKAYQIKSVGTTNFMAIGAGSNTVNVIFTATGPGSGTGTANASHPTESVAIQFESVTRIAGFSQSPPVLQNATQGDALITNNRCHNIGSFIRVTMNIYNLDVLDNINIHHNVLENMGYSKNTYDAVFNFILGTGVRINNVNIDNNTIVGAPGVGPPQAILMLDGNSGTIQNIRFRNNIAVGITPIPTGTVAGFGYLVFRAAGAKNNIFSQNNIVFQNAFTNNPFTFAGTPAPTSFTNTGNLKVNPQFVSSTDFHVLSGSPAIGNGLNPPEPGLYIGAYPSGGITPTITWSNPAAIVYLTPISATQLNATSGGVPGTHNYTINGVSLTIGTILNAGTYTILDTFVPTDGTTYTTATKSVTLVVNPAPASISYPVLSKVFNNTPQGPTITTSPAGLPTNTTFDGVSGLKTHPGSWTVVTGITDPNYSAAPVSATFTITKAVLTITASNLSQSYNGSTHPITFSTTPNVTGLVATYTGISGTTYGPSTTPPTNAGTYRVDIDLSHIDYQATSVTVTLTVAKATPSINAWNPASPITYPTAIGAAQNNLTSPVAGTFSYSPANGFIPTPGTLGLSATFTPTDLVNYNVVNGITASITVNKGAATINVSNTNQFFDGLPKPVTISTTPAGLEGSVTVTYTGTGSTVYGPSTTPPSAIGTYSYNAVMSNANYTATPASGTLTISSTSATIFISNYTGLAYNGSPISPTVTSPYSYAITFNGSATVPTVPGSYVTIATINDGIHTGADTVTMTIVKGNPTGSWANPASITTTTALSSTQNNASFSVAGVITYSPANGVFLPAGNQILSATLVPTDGNYNTVTITVPITVTSASATLSLSGLSYVYDGTDKQAILTSNPAGLSGLSLTYNGGTSLPNAAGSYAVVGHLSNPNYTATDVLGTLVIAKGTAILTWPQPLTPVPFGTVLGPLQLNATSNIPGTFSYAPAAGVTPGIGTNGIIATFTPTDTNNYNTTTITNTLNVYGVNPFLNYFIIGAGGVIYIKL